jgi:hypothetical protein
MRVQILTRSGEELEFELDPDQPAIRLEFRALGADPDLPTALWLHELSELRVSEHPPPAVQEGGEPPPETEWDVSRYGSDGNGGYPHGREEDRQAARAR